VCLISTENKVKMENYLISPTGNVTADKSTSDSNKDAVDKVIFLTSLVVGLVLPI
jgi:hypothetical protein